MKIKVYRYYPKWNICRFTTWHMIRRKQCFRKIRQSWRKLWRNYWNTKFCQERYVHSIKPYYSSKRKCFLIMFCFGGRIWKELLLKMVELKKRNHFSFQVLLVKRYVYSIRLILPPPLLYINKTREAKFIRKFNFPFYKARIEITMSLYHI